MNLFVDTSALVKFFHEEEGTEFVTELLSSQEHEIWLLEIARLEFLSAVFRRFRNNELDSGKLEKAIFNFEAQLASFNIEPLGQTIIREAEFLLMQYGKKQGLRTLDALHLATFSLISEEDWTFMASDDNLCSIAVLLGYRVINPLKI